MITGARSSRAALFLVGAVVLMASLVGYLYRETGYWRPKGLAGGEFPTVDDTTGTPFGDTSDDVSIFGDDRMREMYLKEINKPLMVDAPMYQQWGSFEWELEGEPIWTEPLGERLCIIDLDNRPFDKPGQIFSEKMTWDNASQVHGLSVGFLNHWLYAKIHGYTYYYIEIEEYHDRRTSWKKAPVIAEILKEHDTCIFIDSDAIFHRLDLPFEWLMNYWELDPDKNSLALAIDPELDHNRNKFGDLYLNTGFIIAQNNEKTFEILDEWEKCPNDDSKYPDCKDFRYNAPGSPTDQGGFGTYIRYDYAENIKELPCTEANGFAESKTGCSGLFIQHLWTGKSDWIKVRIGEQLPGKFLELFHQQFIAEKDEFFQTEPELMGDEMN